MTAARGQKVTLYVKERDAAIWEQARHLSSDSLSSTVIDALASHLKQKGERLEIATRLLMAMIGNSGSKEEKVKAAYQYADLLIAGNQEKER